jgi:RNA-binding protein YlmH
MKSISQNEMMFSKIDDKIKFCSTRNKITHTDFFTEPEVIKINKYLNSINCKNYFWNGIKKDADRKMLFFYPEKLNLELANSQINKILSIIRITLPNALKRYI